LFPCFFSNIKMNLHLITIAFYNSGKGKQVARVPLHYVLHYCLRKVLGHKNILIYILFLYIYNPKKPTNFLGRDGGLGLNLL
jgi:hypothetical protein